MISRKLSAAPIRMSKKKYYLCTKCDEPIKSGIAVFPRLMESAWCIECWSDELAMREALVAKMEEPDPIDPPLGYKFQGKEFIEMMYMYTPIFGELEH